MTGIVCALAAVLIIGTTAAVCYLSGREHGYKAGRADGYGEGWKQCAFDTDMDAMHPDEELNAYLEATGGSEVTS